MKKKRLLGIVCLLFAFVGIALATPTPPSGGCVFDSGARCKKDECCILTFADPVGELNGYTKFVVMDQTVSQPWCTGTVSCIESLNFQCTGTQYLYSSKMNEHPKWQVTGAINQGAANCQFKKCLNPLP